MRHPHKYGRALKITFSFTYLLDATAAVVGILMFGDDVMDASKSTEAELFLTSTTSLFMSLVSWSSHEYPSTANFSFYFPPAN